MYMVVSLSNRERRVRLQCVYDRRNWLADWRGSAALPVSACQTTTDRPTLHCFSSLYVSLSLSLYVCISACQSPCVVCLPCQHLSSRLRLSWSLCVSVCSLSFNINHRLSVCLSVSFSLCVRVPMLLCISAWPFPEWRLQAWDWQG